METDNASPVPPSAPDLKPLRVKILGVGTAGVTLLETMARADFPGAQFIAVNTDAATPTTAGFVSLETQLLRGLGTGGDPARGHQMAEEHFPRLREACSSADVIFIVAGLGGGTGSGVGPVVARAARESGALVLAFVTLPFACEGNRRHDQAQRGLEQLRTLADGVVCLPNQKAFQLLDQHATLLDTFRFTAQLLIEAVQGAWRLLKHRGLIEIHFEELCGLLRGPHGESCFATMEASGATRAGDVIAKLPGHPLLDGGQALADAATVLVSIMGGPNLAMAEVNRVMAGVSEHCKTARVIMGAAVAEHYHERLAVTLIATRPAPGELARLNAARPAATQSATSGIETELLHPSPVERPSSRSLPPAPALTAEQRERIVSRPPGPAARVRKTGSRMKQGTLPLDIVNKGRFDKSEPTIHKGEDLDVPTYIRRGVALN
jgi:cell division protein FtsZ